MKLMQSGCRFGGVRSKSGPFYEAAVMAEYLTPEELAAPREGERGKLGVA
jgi:hypothetical protein